MVAAAAWPMAARACSCGGSGAERATPSDGVYPANADLVLWDQELCTPPDVSQVAARIDGAEAQVTAIEGFFGLPGGVSSQQVRLTPAPTPGQLVEVVRCATTYPCTFAAADAEALTSYMAGEPDLSAPGSAAIERLEVTRWETLCGDEAEGWEVEVAGLPPASAAEPVVYRIELAAEPGGPAIATKTRTEIREDSQPFVVRFTEMLPKEATEVCARVTAVDLAGNAGPTAEVCGAERGCGCRSSDAGAGLLAVVLLGLRRRSRRTGRSGQ